MKLTSPSVRIKSSPHCVLLANGRYKSMNVCISEMLLCYCLAPVTHTTGPFRPFRGWRGTVAGRLAFIAPSAVVSVQKFAAPQESVSRRCCQKESLTGPSRILEDNNTAHYRPAKRQVVFTPKRYSSFCKCQDSFDSRSLPVLQAPRALFVWLGERKCLRQ